MRQRPPGPSLRLSVSCVAPGRERQLEGIAKAKEAGVYNGGTRRIDREAVQSLHREGKGPTEIAKALGISRMHAYRLVKVMEAVAGGAAA